MNLLNFSKMVQTFFEGSFISSFQNWEAAFEYITGKISDEKLVLIIDELPFLAEPAEERQTGAAVCGTFHAAARTGRHSGAAEGPA